MSTHCCNSCAQGLPCESAFKPEVQSNTTQQHAIPAIPIALNSGLFINAKGELDVDCAIMGSKCAWPVGPTSPAPAPFTWTVAPSRITEGQQVTVNVSGLLPFALFTVRVTPQVGTIEYLPLTADANGNVVNAKLRLGNAQDAVVFTPIYVGGTPNVSNYSVEVLPCGVQEECTCQGSATVTPFVTSNSIVSGQSVSLLLVVKNTNSCPITSFNLPALNLPAAFTSATPVSISNATIPGKGTRTFEFILQAQNLGANPEAVSITVPASSGTYLCDGNSFSAGGGTVSLTIAPATGSYCGLAIDSFAYSAASVAEGVSVNLSVTVRNSGSSPITNIAMPNLFIGGPDVQITAGATAIGFPAIATLAPGTTHTVTVAVTYNALVPNPANHTVILPAGGVYGTCNGSQISNGVARQATVTIT